MDCPSEEQMIRMKLSDMRTIKSLDFDIPNRKLIVFHTDEKDKIFKKLEELKVKIESLEKSLAKMNLEGKDLEKAKAKILKLKKQYDDLSDAANGNRFDMR